MKRLVVFALCLWTAGAAPKEIPSSIPVCRMDQTFNQCFKKATVTLQPRLAKGIRELNIPALEPLKIPMVKLEQGTGAVNYKAKLSNINVYGLSNYNLKDFNGIFSENGVKLNGVLDLPKIRLISEYNIDGRVLLLPIRGNGDFSANITNCKAKFLNSNVLTMKKGLEYLQTKDTKVQLHIDGVKVHFGNLFNGDPVLSQTTNDFFNQNSKDILNEIKPAIEDVVAMLFDDVLNKVFQTAPYDKLIPK